MAKLSTFCIKYVLLAATLIFDVLAQQYVPSQQYSSSLGYAPVGTVSRFGLGGDSEFAASLGNAPVGVYRRQQIPYQNYYVPYAIPYAPYAFPSYGVQRPVYPGRPVYKPRPGYPVKTRPVPPMKTRPVSPVRPVVSPYPSSRPVSPVRPVVPSYPSRPGLPSRPIIPTGSRPGVRPGIVGRNQQLVQNNNQLLGLDLGGLLNLGDLLGGGLLG